ncbi:MAG: hypothetical protein RLZZ223_333 [Candidatus Parcubacteria bacterium]
MNPTPKLLNILFQKNSWNFIFIILLFPIYLYFIQINRLIFNIWSIGGFVMFLVYLWVLYRSNLRSYQVPLHFIISSILFMGVIKGDTVPLPLIVFVLGLGLFFVQDIISHQEYKKSELMRQIIISGIVFMSFSTYAFLFGSVFILSISPIILGLLAFLSTLNMITYLLWMYGVDSGYYTPISIIGSFLITQIFLVVRILPFTHLTQSMLLTIYMLFSASVFRDAYLSRLSIRNIMYRVTLTLILSGLLIFTSVP